MEQENKEIEGAIVYAVIPKLHVAYLLANYFFQMGVVAKEAQIKMMNIPIDVDDHDDVTIKMEIVGELLQQEVDETVPSGAVIN